MATYDLTTSIPSAANLAAGDTLNCTYTGSEIVLTLAPGKYKIEAYGAAGGTTTRNTNYKGGEGGYSYGTLSTETEITLYLNAGGKGGSGASSTSTKNEAGYNGGGYSYYYAGAGGGASHVATASGLLSTLENNKDAILIVAGGGGGSSAYSSSGSSSSSYCGAGGAGGGESGGAGYYGTSNTSSNALKYAGQAGTQSSGGAAGTNSSRKGSAGSFGQGGNGGTASSSYYGEGGGGGGYYGGGGASGNEAGGGGGSGYLSSNLTESATSQGGNDSNGYITITVIEIYTFTHNITFYDGVNVLGVVETKGEEVITLPVVPKKDGYEFVGYFLSDGTTQITSTTYSTTKLENDVDCYAKYRKFNINFYSNSQLYYTVASTGKEEITFPTNPTLDGYTFTNWYLDDNTTVFNNDYLSTSYLTKDINVYAHYVQKYSVKFICDNTTYKEILSSGYESIDVPETYPTKAGYHFVGWFIDSNYQTAYTIDYFESRSITQDAVIYGQLEQDITIEPSTTSNINFYVQNELYYTFATKGKESITLPNNPSIEGYRFKGWYADLTYTIPVDSDYLSDRWINSDISVYAQLEEKIKYTISYIINNRVYYSCKSSGEEVFKIPSNPKITDYEFLGWYEDSKYQTEYDNTRYKNTILNENLSVYGKVKYTKKHNINFYDSIEDTTVYATISTTGGESLTLPENPEAALGYQFKGWFLDKKLTVSFAINYYTSHWLTSDVNVYAGYEVSSSGPYALNITHDGTGNSNPAIGTYNIAKGTTTNITITPTTENFKYLEINGEIVDVVENSYVTPTNAVAYFDFNSDSSDSFGKSTTSTQGTPSLNSSVTKFGNQSIYFGGSAALLITLPDSFSDAFTLEMWVNTTKANASGSYPTIFSTDGTSSYGNIYCHVDDGSYGTKMVCRANSAGAYSNTGSYGSTVISRNEWHHFAYCRSGSNNYYFLDGVLQATVTQSSPQTISTICLGGLIRNSTSSFASDSYFTGYMDDVLISSGCKYTADFTIPTEAYDAHTVRNYTYEISEQANNIDAKIYFGNLGEFTITSEAIDGVITPSGNTIVTENGSQIYQCQSSSTSELKALLVNGVAVETTSTGSGSSTVYEYTLKHVRSDTTIKAIFSSLLYVKLGENWTGVSKVYKKINGSWVEQETENLSSLFSTTENYAQGTYTTDDDNN